MKFKLSVSFLTAMLAAVGSAQSLNYVGSEAQESLPLKWAVGVSGFYDDNVNAGLAGPEEDSWGVNPYVGLTFINITPQTTWDVYAKLGLIYYFTAPDNVEEANSNSRLEANLTHRFDERLRFSSRNFVAYELNPDYSIGYTSSSNTGEYFYWQTDNSLGYRWTERLGTYTGIIFRGVTYPDAANSDSDNTTWEAYNQFRYQFGPQTVLTFDYRYSMTHSGGNASDFSDQFLLVGAEHRFSPNTIGIVRAGAQLHDVDGGENTTSPYVEVALKSQVNQQMSVRGYARYGIEGYSSVQFLNNAGLVEYNDSRSLRIGVSSEYAISSKLSAFGGIDFLPTSFEEGQSLSNPPFVGAIDDLETTIFNAYVGVSMKLTEILTGTLTYNFTDSASDIDDQEYTRNRINLGVSAEF